jgi:hypothetical protein
VLLDGVDPVVLPVVPLVPELDGAVPVVPPGVALVEPVVAPLLAPLLLVLFVAPAPMPAALRVVVMSVDFIDVLVVDWQPAANTAARQKPSKAAGRREDWILMCDDSLLAKRELRNAIRQPTCPSPGPGRRS